MKVFVIITCLVVASVYAAAPPTIPSLITLIPTIFQCLIPLPSKLSIINLAIIKIQYYLSSRTVPDPVELSDDNLNLINSTIPTKIIVHGWLQNESIPMYAGFRAAYLKRDNYNVITVDWGKYSNSIDYIESAYYVPRVGIVLGEFLKTLNNVIGIPFERMHLLGLSLGAHVVGVAGKEVQASGSMIGRITGMDPAGPCFSIPFLKPANARLNGSDATFVDVIHTDAGWWGIQENIGKVDFRANKGTRVQPGCNDFFPSSFLGALCSHNRSSELYIASILSDSMVVHLGTGNIIFGENTPAATATGVYYFETTNVAPYGKN